MAAMQQEQAKGNESTYTSKDKSRATPVFSEVEHHYGEGVHILDDPYSLTLLSRLSDHRTGQPEINRLIATLYQILLHATVSYHFPLAEVSVRTRMFEENPDAVWTGHVLDPATRVIIVALARAGLIPANLCFESLNDLLNAPGIRQDHFMINRQTGDDGSVTGAAISGCKVGGEVDDAFIMIPDPMGATGSSILQVLEYYRESCAKKPGKVILMHLVITPEYIKAIRTRHPDALIMALRLDRGLSPKDVLECMPGERWDEERGLNGNDYIIPGIGGLGEMMNNSWV
jgi:uracil phosphoribosyltransferase